MIPPKQFTATVKGTELILEIINMAIQVSPGVYIDLNLHEYLEVTTLDRPDGSKILWFKQTNHIVTHTIRKEDWVQALEITAEIFAAVLLGAFGLGAGGKFVNALVARGLSLIASRIILAILMGLAGGIAYVLINMAKWIAMANDNNFNDFPPLDKLLATGLARIEWPDSSGFKVRSVDLRKSLRVGLEPQFIA